jgi:hypothetical protein
MADILLPWNGHDKSPEHNQLIIASIEPSTTASPRYLIATYQQYGDEDASLSFPTFAGFAGEGTLPFRYVLAWQPLNIQQPNQ